MMFAQTRFKTFRNGWPDFFVQDLQTKELFGLEVKQGGNTMSASQRAMFAALELLGLKILVWNPSQPHRFTDWRAYKPEPVLYMSRVRLRDRRLIAKLARQRGYPHTFQSVAAEMIKRGLALERAEQATGG